MPSGSLAFLVEDSPARPLLSLLVPPALAFPFCSAAPIFCPPSQSAPFSASPLSQDGSIGVSQRDRPEVERGQDRCNPERCLQPTRKVSSFFRKRGCGEGPSLTATETSCLCVPLTFVCPLVGQPSNQQPNPGWKGASPQSEELITKWVGACPPVGAGGRKGCGDLKSTPLGLCIVLLDKPTTHKYCG